MALKGNLETVNLPDVFQILARQGQAGLLQIFSADGARYVELERGRICAVSGAGGGARLGDLLIHHGYLKETDLDTALNMQKTRNAKLGQILVDNKFCTQEEIEDAVRFQVQEEICDLFMIKSAEFEFFAGTQMDEKLALGGKFVKLNINPDSVLLEAARRMDEWSTIETKIPSGATLFTVTDIGRDYFQSADRSTQVVLALINDLRTFDSIVGKSCLGRFQTGRIISQMLDAGAIQHLAFELYPQIAEKHMNQRHFKEAALIYRYSIDYIQDPTIRETMFKNLQIVEQRLAEQESGGVEMQPSEIVRSPRLAGGRFSRRTVVLVALLLVVVVVGGGIGVGMLFSSGIDESSLDDTAFETQATEFEQACEQEEWVAARQLLTQMAPKKAANQERFLKLQDRLLLDGSAQAKQALEKLAKIDPTVSLSEAKRYISTGRALVKNYPETLGLKVAVAKEIKALDYALDGLSKKIQNQESTLLLANLQAAIGRQPTEDTLKFIALARDRKNLTEAVENEFRLVEETIKSVRATQAAALERYRACRAEHRNLEALAEADFILQLQASAGFGPTPEYQALTQTTAPNLQELKDQVAAEQSAYQALATQPNPARRALLPDLDALLKQYPGSLENGRIRKLIGAIEQFGE